jgi:hypothetical protein
MRARSLSLIVLALPLLLAWPLGAREARPFRLEASAGTGVAVWDAAPWSETELALALGYRGVSAAVLVPLRVDLAEGRFRDEDYDEAGDYLRLLENLSWRDEGIGVTARLGSLSELTLGRGELVKGYANNLNLDRPETGLYLGYRGGRVSAQGFVASLLDPDLVGARVATRPFADLRGFYRHLELDAAWVMDTSAPVLIEPGQRGDAVWREEATTLFSGGMALPIINRYLDATPYVSAAGLDTDGGGLHAGLATIIKPQAPFKVVLSQEYRFTWGAYAPEYVNAAYPLERIRAVDDLPKLDALLQGDRIGDGHGLAVRARVQGDAGWFVEAALGERQGRGNTDGELRASLALPMGFDLEGLIVHRSADDVADLFGADQALVVTELRYRIIARLSARLFYARALRDDDEGVPELFHRGLLGIKLSGAW